jgi:enoyl-[acyl-carrier protein] reductase I
MSLGIDLKGKRGLVVGIANEQSIAYGCAKSLHAVGAELAITYLNEKTEPHVRPLAEQLDARLCLPCDVRESGQLEAVFAEISRAWGRLDFLIHSIAFAPKDDLHGRVVDCSAEGFKLAMDVSCHSFIRMAALAEPLMVDGGCLQTISFQGAERVVAHYNLMGPVKAALECAVRYMAVELGPKRIRVHAISPGPIATRAASGIDHFDDLMARVANSAPSHQLVTIDQVGYLSAFLAADAAAGQTGGVHYVDGGYNIIG